MQVRRAGYLGAEFVAIASWWLSSMGWGAYTLRNGCHRSKMRTSMQADPAKATTTLAYIADVEY